MPRKDTSHTLYFGNDLISARAALRAFRGDKAAERPSKVMTRLLAVPTNGQGQPPATARSSGTAVATLLGQPQQTKQKVPKLRQMKPPYPWVFIVPASEAAAGLDEQLAEDSCNQWYTGRKKMAILDAVYVSPIYEHRSKGFLLLGLAKRQEAESYPVILDLAKYVLRALRQSQGALRFAHRPFVIVTADDASEE